MSILKSTKAGIQGVHLTLDDYMEHGYKPGNFDNNPSAPTKLWYDDKHYLMRNDFTDPNTKDCLYYAYSWGWGRFYINNFKDLELIEAYWSAKLQKTRARYKRKIEKALNIEHRKRLHRWEETRWSTAI